MLLIILNVVVNSTKCEEQVKHKERKDETKLILRNISFFKNYHIFCIDVSPQ